MNRPMNADAINAAAKGLARRQAEKRRIDAEREAQARHDAAQIINFLVHHYQPVRIYQWGSLTKPGTFREYSDIDIAVEGILDPACFFRMLDDVGRLTQYDVDCVQIERIEPEYAEWIRSKGRIVYERDRCG